MDKRGGCCIARYASVGGVYDMSKMDRIMLRFRPIAPKPAASGSASGGSTAENGEVHARSGRGKRRYVRDGNRSSKRCSNRKRKASSEETDPVHKTSSGGSVSGGETVVTLPLLPETPDWREYPAGGYPSERSDLTRAEKQAKKAPMWLNFSENDNRGCSGVGRVSTGVDRTVVMSPQPLKLVGLLVTVECVTDTWDDGYGMGYTDEERIMKLGMDTCPGFISDELNRVGWTNGALRKMMVVEEEEEEEGGGGEVVVWLVVKERVPITCRAFTCRVRLQYTCGKRSSLTLPCDVWKMDDGGFAWRLDVKAALCLGRFSVQRKSETDGFFVKTLPFLSTSAAEVEG